MDTACPISPLTTARGTLGAWGEAKRAPDYWRAFWGMFIFDERSPRHPSGHAGGILVVDVRAGPDLRN